MAAPQPLPPVSFSATRGQRSERIFAGISCVTVGIGILIFAGRAGKDEVGIIVAGVLLAVLGSWFLAALRARTTIDAEGLRTSSVFGPRSCRWSEVTDVDLKIDATDGDPIVYHIKIRRRGGRPFTLSAPMDSSRKGRHVNPDFTEQLATIRSYWQASSRQPQTGQY